MLLWFIFKCCLCGSISRFDQHSPFLKLIFNFWKILPFFFFLLLLYLHLNSFWLWAENNLIISHHLLIFFEILIFQGVKVEKQKVEKIWSQLLIFFKSTTWVRQLLAFVFRYGNKQKIWIIHIVLTFCPLLCKLKFM